MQLFREALGGDPALDVAAANAMVRRVGKGESGAAVRVYRPRGRVVAFGRRDALRPGFAAAAGAARDAGFTPVLRAPGGLAVAYTERSLVVDHVSPDPGRLSGMDERFREYGELWAEVLRGLGVDARVGAVPGEYCPGAYSVNARGTVKLVGTAQRVIRGAWLFSAVAIFDDAEVLRPLLAEVYHHLERPFDTASVGAIRDEAAGLSLDVVEHAVLAAYGERFGLAPGCLDDRTRTAAEELLADHRVA